MSIVFTMLLHGVPCLTQNYDLPLWPDEIPNHIANQLPEKQDLERIRWITQVQMPTVSVYLPAKQHATGQAILICPGGGYGGLAYDWEGTDIAKWLNSKGIAGIVLKYRLPSTSSQQIPRLAPLQDAKQALRMIRGHASQWNIEEDKIGIMGFSAGGHLAASLGTRFNDSEADVTKSEWFDISARPDFMVLIYPVISMKDSITHQGSRSNLLGDSPGKDMIERYSNEFQVTTNSPPTFLVHSSDDATVPVENSLLFYRALIEHLVPVEMHLYPHGGHGYSLALDHGHLKFWPELLAQWLESLN